jgi:predicted Zn-dependent peptidase
MRAALAALGERPLEEPELDRVRRVFQADWVYGQERIHQQALATGAALAQFDLRQPERLLARALEAEPEALAASARRWLVPERGSVVGLSLPESRG